MFADALLMSALLALAGARIYDRCELARDLQILGVDKDQIATWVCIAYHESRYDTAAQNYGSGDHGLLQISELYWCGPGKACGAPCSAFRDEDISDDVKCALRIYKEHTRLQGDGFLAWVVYPHHCKQNAKKYIVDCDKNLKNLPVKFEDRARYFKPSEIKYEVKPQVASIPYQNPSSPRYLAINSIFQGSYINEFERNYYDNNKQSNWLNFKVDNIDELTLPGAVSDKQRSRLAESSTRPTTTTESDPALIGIKPPSPRKIESNQFRRRKTFTEPLFLKNRLTDAQKTTSTTTSPIRASTATSLSFPQDLQHNIFLNLMTSVPSRTFVNKLPPQEIKSTDFSKYNVKFPQAEESSSTILTYDDLAGNPFLNSLPGFNLKSRTVSPFKVSGFQLDNSKSYTSTTPRPANSLRTSKQIGRLRPDADSSLQTSTINKNADAKLSIEDLSQNPFLSHLLRGNKIISSTETSANRETKLIDVSKNYRKDFTFTTVKPSTELVVSSSQKWGTSTKLPRITEQRGRARFSSNVDTKTSEKPTTERATVTYSTRQYKTISRQRSSTKSDNLKGTTALIPNAVNTEVTSTIKPFTNNFNTKNSRIETTTSRTTTSKSFYNASESNSARIGLQTARVTQTTSRAEITKVPEASSKINTLGNSRNASSQYGASITAAAQKQPESRQAITNRPQTARQQINSSTASTSTTRRLQTTTQKTTSTTSTTLRPQTTSRPESTSKPSTTTRSSRRFWEGSQNITSTTPLPRVTWKTPTNSTLTSTSRYYSTTPKPAFSSTTKASTAKTTISIFDLYLKPSTRPSFKPFEFTNSLSRPYRLSIFSGGTTKPPPSYFTTKKPTTEEVRKTNTQNVS